ncbi:two-component regulator propeller domain-containing protein [Membranihabitans marinus]
MWFGTKDGLARFDGYEYKVYSFDASDSMSLSNNFITVLFEDENGNIWVGTIDGHVNLFIPQTEQFFDVPFIADDLEVKKITTIQSCPNGEIWVGTDGNGLWHGELDGQALNLFTDYDAQTGFSLQVSHLAVDEEQLWIAGENGVFELTRQGHEYRLEALDFGDFVDNKEFPKCGISANYIFVDSAELWIGHGCGLIHWDKEKKKASFYPNKYADYRYGWGNIFEIKKVDDGYLWLGILEDLVIFDIESKSYNYYDGKATYLPKVGIKSIYKDNSGVVWLGSNGGGLSVWSKNAHRFGLYIKPYSAEERIPNFSVRTIFEDDNDNVWISSGLLYRWNRRSNTLKSYETNSYDAEDFGNTGVWSIIEDSKGYLWFGTYEGLYRYNPDTEVAEHIEFTPSLFERYNDKLIFEIFEDSHQQIWFTVGKYLCKLKSLSGEVEEYPILDYRLANISGFESIYEDDEGVFYINTNMGLIKFNPQTGDSKSYTNDIHDVNSLNFNDVKCLLPDPQQPDEILWLGTGGGGLNKFYIKEERFEAYTEADGLPNNVVYGILADENNNLWMSTNLGLSKFNIEEETFTNYTSDDGLQSNEFNSGAYFKSKRGEMFFGGIKGLNYFYPHDLVANPVGPKVALTDFKIANHSVEIGDSTGILPQALAYTSEIVLPYKMANIFSFTFAGLEYSAVEKNTYAYQLMGFNDDWVYSGHERSSTYTNISPGKYTFRVKAANNDGVWNEEGKEISITILPPYWQSEVAYFLYILLALLIIYGIWSYFYKRNLMRNQILYQQLERDKLLALDEIKTQFFANISHDLRTPLTLIKGPVETLLTENTSAEQTRLLQVVQENTNRLKSLIDQILDISKLDAVGIALEKSEMDIISFAKGVFSSYAFYAETKEIEMVVESNWDSLNLEFDSGQLEKVFHNLISNAFKHTQKGGQIKLIIGKGSENKYSKWQQKSYVEISIKNTGSQLPDDVLPKLFNKYYTYQTENSGAGLGLTIVKEMVELHGGFVRVGNTKKGIRFSFLLPVKAEILSRSLKTVSRQIISHIPTIVTKSSQVDAIAEFVSPNENPLILIVEDTYDLRKFLAQVLQKKYRVIEAGDGEEALEIAIEQIPDLIVSDWMMPKMDGLQFCASIRENLLTCHIPVIILTARAMQHEVIDGYDKGVDQYLTKPFSSEELLVRIKNLLDQRKLLKNLFQSQNDEFLPDREISQKEKEFQTQILELLEENLSNPDFSANEFCKVFFMSERQMRRKINAEFNMTPNQLIRNFRLHKARELLRNTNSSITEICFAVGFNELTYFSKRYKEFYGHSPSEVRAGNVSP